MTGLTMMCVLAAPAPRSPRAAKPPATVSARPRGWVRFTWFTPVRSVDSLERTFSRPRTQADLWEGGRRGRCRVDSGGSDADLVRGEVEEARLAAEQAALKIRVTYNFSKGAYLGTGLTRWDFTHKDITTLGWLGTAGFFLLSVIITPL